MKRHPFDRGDVSSDRHQMGLTIVEVLIAGFILVIVLGLGSAFLSEQSRLQRLVQAKSSLQDRARVVLQIVTQDLSLAGNSVLVGTSGQFLGQYGDVCSQATSFDTGDPAYAARAACLYLGATGVVVSYASTQFPAGQECRRVGYRFDSDLNLLERADVPCTLGGAAVEPTLSSLDEYFEVFAPNTTSFEIEILCSTGMTFVADCGGGYPRSARVTYSGQSPPLRGGNIITYSMTQEIVMPNLKDKPEAP